MPTRYLRPGIRDSERIDAVTPLAETLYCRLIVTVDDFGRFDGRPSMVKSHCFPVKKAVTEEVCEGLLDELAAADLLIAYVVDGKPYLQLQRWDNAPRAKVSKFPAPTDDRAQVHTYARNPSTVLPGTGTGTGTKTETENRKPKPTLAPPPAVAGKAAPASAETWASYSTAYRARYGELPVRNAKVNGQIANLIARLGAEEAPAVAAFYVGHNRQLYVSAMHVVDLLLRDAEKLRTEWATGRQVTNAQARQADNTQTNFNAFAPLLAAAEAQHQKEANADA